MSEHQAQKTSISDLGVNHVVIEDRGRSKLKQLALASALSLSMSEGALAVNAPEAVVPVPQYSAADFAKESIDKKLAAKQESMQNAAPEKKPSEQNPQESRISAAMDAVKETQGFGKDTTTFSKITNFLGTAMIMGDSQTALIKTGAEVLIAGTVGAGSKSAENGIAAAGYISDAATVFGTGGLAVAPILYRYGKDGYDAYQEAEQKRFDKNMAAVQDRTLYVAEVYTYSMRLEDREKRMADTPENQAAYNKRMLEDAKQKVEVGGYASERLNSAIELEDMVQRRGGEVESWYDQYLKYKSEYKPKEPDINDFFGKANDVKNTELSASSATDFLRTLGSYKDKGNRFEMS